MSEEIKTLIARRTSVKSTVTRIKTFLNNYQKSTEQNIFQLKTRLPALRSAFKDYDDIQIKIELIDVKHAKDRDNFETVYYDVESKILEILENHERPPKTQSQVQNIDSETFTRSAISNVRLPILNLPTFSGSYIEWVSFRDTFKSLIHNSSAYSDIEKFHYLKSSLKGDSHKVIEAFTVTDNNYPAAWEALVKRFENERIITQEHVLAILNSPSLTKSSHSGLRKMFDDISVNLSALKALNQPVDQWDTLLIPIITSKFDYLTKREWESTLNTGLPTIAQIKDFLERRCFLLESLNSSNHISKPINNTNNKNNYGRSNHYTNKTNSICNVTSNVNIKGQSHCLFCKKPHLIFHCIEFLKLNINDRINQIKALKLCLNCFRANHLVEDCKSNSVCRYCKQKHNSLLHQDVTNSNAVTAYVKNSNKFVQTLLSTAEVFIKDQNSKTWVKCRALLDQGSQLNFICHSLAKDLGLERKSVDWSIVGINNTESTAKELVPVHIKSSYNTFNLKIDCLVLPTITENLPLQSFTADSINIPSNIKLADPNYNISNTIDILLGAEIIWKILLTDQIKPNNFTPHLQNTCLGWILGGNIKLPNSKNMSLCNVSLSSLNKQINKFGEIEEHPSINKSQQMLSPENIQCERYFPKTLTRDHSGRFIVKLPFKADPSVIGDTKQIAISRLKNSHSKFDQKFPIVLPKHHLTQIKSEHESQLHAGPSATLAAIRKKYWLLDGRNQVRFIIRNCIKCFRVKPINITPKMGDLPESRVTASRPFLNCGVDYGGPIIIKEGGRRSKKTNNVYICLFICFATKAIHVELVGDLTAQGFLNSLKRFVSRRGMIRNIYSDNATNFRGAENELKKLIKIIECSNEINNYLLNVNIKWHFIPSRSPHFGGIWEAGIKSVKMHIKRVIGNTILTYEEMLTLLVSIEACLNSRPLCPLSEDPADTNVLTPGHFLIGCPLTALAEPSLQEVPTNRLSRWQHVEFMRQHFWNRWSAEYLSTLQQRTKWHRNDTTPIEVGNLVLLKEASPPLTWRMGRIMQLHKGSDEIVRVVTVKTANGETTRAVKNICVLPCSDSDCS